MKFIFDRAVKNVDEGFNHTVTQSFEGVGPWVMQGLGFNSADDWFDYAKKVGRALGITDCECAVLPSDQNQKSFIFSFKNEDDYMAFQVGIAGYNSGEHAKNFISPTAEASIEFAYKVMNFIQSNEIDAKIARLDDQKIRVITNNQLDYFAISQAYLKGAFAPQPTTRNEPNNPQP